MGVLITLNELFVVGVSVGIVSGFLKTPNRFVAVGLGMEAVLKSKEGSDFLGTT